MQKSRPALSTSITQLRNPPSHETKTTEYDGQISLIDMKDTSFFLPDMQKVRVSALHLRPLTCHYF